MYRFLKKNRFFSINSCSPLVRGFEILEEAEKKHHHHRPASFIQTTQTTKSVCWKFRVDFDGSLTCTVNVRLIQERSGAFIALPLQGGRKTAILVEPKTSNKQRSGSRDPAGRGFRGWARHGVVRCWGMDIPVVWGALRRHGRKLNHSNSLADSIHFFF